MTQVILSGKAVRADLEASPIGVFDVIRDDVRIISSVKPVDRVFVERTKMGYRGVLYSKEKPYMFALNGNGFIAKPIEDDPKVIEYCSDLEDKEQKLTAELDAKRADQEIDNFNSLMGEASHGASVAAEREDAPKETTNFWGPMGDDPIERVPGAYRKIMPLSVQRDQGKEESGVCGGGIVVNKDGKVLLVKPRGGYGGYDWTFPKGYPAKVDDGFRENTAVREVREETGYRVFVKRFVGRFTHNDGGSCDYFVCDIDGSKPVGEPDPHETSAVKWCTLVEALELLNDDVDVRILAQANSLIPKLVIKGGHSGTMIALFIPAQVAKKVAIKGGEKPASLHVTLAYLGKKLSDQQKKMAASVVRKFANSFAEVKATLGGVGRFSASESSEWRDVVYLSVDSPQLTKLRHKLVDALADVGLQPSEAHGYTPHVTLAYIEKGVRTPIERVDPIEVVFKTLSLSIAEKKMSFPFSTEKDVSKALPRMGDDERDSKVGTKPSGASKKQVGATGKTRYTYPGEQGGGAKKPGGDQQPAEQTQPGQPQQEQHDELPHPDTPPPQPVQEPIAAEHPEKPPVDDPRRADPTAQSPKHTINVGELCAALGIQRSVLQQIVTRMQKNFGAKARSKFTSFLETQLKQFAQEHGLDGDYFGLLFDVLTGKVPEGQPSKTQDQVAKKPGPG